MGSVENPPGMWKDAEGNYDIHRMEPKQHNFGKTTQKPPGNWFARKARATWFSIYGSALMVLKLKVVREMLARNKRYDPGNEPRGLDEVVVITGGPRGIAYELAKKFLQLDFVVIMGARDVTASQVKVDQMRQQGVLTGTIHLLPLNLKSLTSTRDFAERVMALTSRIDILFNNAGIMFAPYESTEDGYESHFQVNYLSHFLLTNLLLPTIKRTSAEHGPDSSCRIINTSSVLHHAGSVDFDNLENCKVYASSKRYFDSKLCQILFTNQLERRLQQEKVNNVHVYAVHPGAIPTELWGRLNYTSCLVKPWVPTVKDGADALVYAALSSKLEGKGGSYLEGMRLARPKSQADNVQHQERLWNRSEFLVQAFA